MGAVLPIYAKAEELELCTKCPNRVRAKGQRYCHTCHAEAQKRYREAHRDGHRLERGPRGVEQGSSMRRRGVV